MGFKIRHQLLVLAIFIFSNFGTTHISFAEDSGDCECQEIKCDPCSEQQGLSFYSQKCGGGDKVKSCAKPKCMPLDPLPSRCQAQKKKAVKRKIASEEKVENFVKSSDLGEKVATAKKVEGKVWVLGSGKQKLILVVGARLHENDIIETEHNGSVLVEFDDGNEFTMTPKSTLKIIRAKFMAAEQKRQTVLELIKGKVRSKVKKKYEGASNYYRVKTRSAVAGVRGTDFVVSFSDEGKEVTTVSTLTGTVELSNEDKSQRRLIEKDSRASFIIAANSSDVFSGDEVKDFIKNGYMTPVYKMSAEEVAEMDWSTQVHSEKERAVAAAKEARDDKICKDPSGELDQCYWTCVNNPVGAKNCEVHNSNVQCVRRRCNANGKWSEESRIPASQHRLCPANGVHIGSCDY